ncbi:MFS transporter [Novosphingobium profundi]|uniref:MFS transporter n=1 Tax=Novosphingobium profundi TaxID=1774954 RepID=UPI001BD933DA|nr:MFS transporter [Novosphingobium profundi]MBT0671464.1 MFS transporter [Novosphingobium profundi]
MSEPRQQPGQALATPTPSPKLSPAATYGPMSLRQANLAMLALTMSLFVAALSNLVVLTAMPRIAGELGASQAAYSWIVTASMLTITITMPIWGRISDLFDKKRLMQGSVAGYVLFSMCAGLSHSAWLIVACRAGIGVCAAGIIILIQTISVEILPPRERAKWVGYRSLIMAVATLGAPTLGGLLTDNLGWRSCFFIGVPVAVVSIALVQRLLRLERPVWKAVRIDYEGAALLSLGITAVMLWVTVTGPAQGWFAPISLALLAVSLALLAAAAYVEHRAVMPILPVDLLLRRDVLMCVLAGIGTGVAFFGSAVFLAQYLQLGRGLTPTQAGLMAIPEAGATVVTSLLVSRYIARSGRYRLPLVAGALLISGGYAVMALIGSTTSLVQIAAGVAMIGAGLGIVSENLVLVVQTLVARDLAGTAGAAVAFFRTLGGVFCVAFMGVVLSHQVDASVREAGFPPLAGKVPELARLAPALRHAIEQGYVSGSALVYLACTLPTLLILACMLLLPERTLDEH